MSLKSFIKDLFRPIFKLSPIPLTKGQRVDHLSKQIIRDYCRPAYNCVDVGAHKGEILDLMLEAAPNGKHFAFEPLPHFFAKLEKKYQQVTLFNCALSDETTESIFHFVTTNPAYSGIKERRYDRKNEKIEKIKVAVRRMDDCIPAETKIHFIKIDVEGAELLTLKGAKRILSSSKPLLLFEHGKGGADSYQYGPQDMYGFLDELGYKIYTLKHYIQSKPHLTKEMLSQHFDKGDEFYFVAY